MARIDPEKLLCKDGKTIADHIRELAEALQQHGKRGIVVVLDKATGNFCIDGHVPEKIADLRRVLYDTADNISDDSPRGDLLKTI